MKKKQKSKNKQRWERVLLSTTIVLTACASQSRQVPAEQPIRLMQHLPQGLTCQSLGNLSSRDGLGCGNMGQARAGNEQTLFYNLKAQARQRGANLIIPGEVQTDGWTGCPSNGLLVEAQLYRCDF